MRQNTQSMRIILAATLTFAALTAWAQDPATIGSINYNSTLAAYEIASADNLKDLATYVNGTGNYSTGGSEDTAHDCEGLTFKMTQDITLDHNSKWNDYASTEDNFAGIGERGLPFCGMFDGGGHTISGLRIFLKGGELVGLFRMIGNVSKSATVKDVKLADARITGNYEVGGIVGYNRNGTVSGCTVGSDVAFPLYAAATKAAHSIGGIVGINKSGSSVTGCTSSAVVALVEGSNANYMGGIVGTNDQGTVSDCHAYGAVLPKAAVAGAIVGDSNSIVNGCTYHSCLVGSSAFNIGTGEYKSTGETTELTDYGDLSNVAELEKSGKRTDIWLFDDRDNQPLISAYKDGASGADITTVDVTLKGHTLYRASHEWNTICLPFKLSNLNGNLGNAAQNGIRYLNTASYDSETGALSINFETSSTIAAQKPYLIRWPNSSISDRFEPKISGVAIDDFSASAPSSDKVNFYTASAPWRRVCLYGTYAPVSPTDGKLFDQHNTESGAFHAYMTISNPPEREGYTFTGWNTKADGSGTTVTNLMPLTEGTDPSFTIYAQWAGNSVTLDLTANSANVLGETKYVTTFYNSALDYRLSSGAVAYTASLVDGNVVFYRIGEAGDIIPKGTAVIVVADAASVSLTKLDADPGVTPHAGNILQGSDTEIATPAGTVYVLGAAGEPAVLGLYKYTGATIPARKAYYVANE